MMAVAGFVSFPALLFNFFVWLGVMKGEAGCYCRIVNVGRKAMGEMAVPMQGTEPRLGA